MDTKLQTIKNSLWAIAIAIALLAVVVGLISLMFKPYKGSNESTGLSISGEDNSGVSTLAEVGTGVGVSRGELKYLEETPDAGEEYVNSVYYLVDSTFIDLRNQAIVDTDHVWGSPNDSMPISSVSTATIKYKDGSLITPANAVMITKPDVLYIGIGTDGLADVTEEEFVQQYNTLIRDIKSASENTVIVCMALASVTEDYNSVDGMNLSMISDGNDWVQYVCRDTGAYYLDIGVNLTAGTALLSKYAAANGKTLNKSGLNVVLDEIRTHEIVVVK